MISLDDLTSNRNFTKGGRDGQRRVTFLPDPPKAGRKYTVISADDHIVEPPHVFENRVPKKFADRAPRVIEKADGSQTWLYDGAELPNVGFNAVVGRPVEEWRMEPARFDEMRRGAWDIDERIHDMDINGIYASVNFPSFLPGFAGQRLQQVTKDPELAMASVQAWNQWHLEEWAGTHPGRIIPCQIPWLLDPDVGAAMIRSNAELGFRAVSFSEDPSQLGFPSIHSGHWEPFIRACAETGTVVNLHIGSSGSSPGTSVDAPPDVVGVLFFAYAIFAAVDWLFSLAAVRYPDLKICLSEEGSAGSRRCSTGSTTWTPTTTCTEHGGAMQRLRRYCNGTFGSAQWRTNRRSRSDTESGWTIFSSSLTTPIAIPHGPVPRPSSMRSWVACRQTTFAR